MYKVKKEKGWKEWNEFGKKGIKEERKKVNFRKIYKFFKEAQI